MSSVAEVTRWRLLIGLAAFLIWPGCRDSGRRSNEPVAPQALESREAVARGRAQFAESCALCHGERADGRGRRHEGFDRPPRDFTSAAWRASTSAGQVFLAIRDGVPGSAMPSWRTLSDAALWDLTSYVLSVASGPSDATVEGRGDRRKLG